MKKNHLKKLAVFSLLLSANFVFSQTEEQIIEIKKANNTQELKNIEESSMLIQVEAKEKALEMAYLKGWAITYVEDGSLYELMRVSEDNRPIYYKTFNQNAAISYKDPSSTYVIAQPLREAISKAFSLAST